jgi:hypothetical protein
VFAQDEGGEGLVGFAEVQINLKDVNDNAVSIESHFTSSRYMREQEGSRNGK